MTTAIDHEIATIDISCSGAMSVEHRPEAGAGRVLPISTSLPRRRDGHPPTPTGPLAAHFRIVQSTSAKSLADRLNLGFSQWTGSISQMTAPVRGPPPPGPALRTLE